MALEFVFPDFEDPESEVFDVAAQGSLLFYVSDFFFSRPFRWHNVISCPSDDGSHARVLLNDSFNLLGEIPALISGVPIVSMEVTYCPTVEP